MIRVRENGGEFGDVSRFKKKFKDLLFPFFGSYNDTTLHGRMMSLFQKVKVCDEVSVRGERKVGVGLTTDEGKLLLQRFGFTEKSVRAVLPGRLVYHPSTYSLEVTDFDINSSDFPKSAAIMELQFGIMALDDLLLPSQIFMSTPQYFDAQSTVTDFVMTPNELPPSGVVTIAVAGVRFYEVVNGERYLLKALNLQSVEVVGV
ncbi:hypothetical protein [Flavobacterium capsici]|uniref:Uncharacterized protein n=1 Tax=Flavobacterium capsici TaxID=3075618 RepID=A0AA96F230_9FLAO|nr:MULTISPECIES: hypothetical protein [unclassified Flavobacterium]WNM19771.1 hypothetical protein RN608_03595 [Flavobacterium sp. PMR2A8]WNM21160.1 hypothetical protein RN605_10765 [Flavobacterium sp. PMTSA4]